MSSGFSQELAYGFFAHGMHCRDCQQVFGHITGTCKRIALVTRQQLQTFNLPAYYLEEPVQGIFIWTLNRLFRRWPSRDGKIRGRVIFLLFILCSWLRLSLSIQQVGAR